MQKVCEACRQSFESPNPRKRFCDASCRSRGHRGAVVALPNEPLTAASSVTAATRTLLEAADRAETPAGASALALAARIDSNSDTGSAMASMVRELRAAVADATAGVAAAADRVDEIRAQREKRMRVSS